MYFARYFLVLSVLAFCVLAVAEDKDSSKVSPTAQVQPGGAVAPSAQLPQLSPALLQALSTSHEGLYEVPLPSGGMKLDLQGRFRHLTIAVKDSTGAFRLNCLGGTEHAHFVTPVNGPDNVGTSEVKP